MEKMLGHLRALDLTDDKGFLCGKILADLGVNVIKVERPGGDPSRNIGGFRGGAPDPQQSLYWFAYNSNKKGVTLDIEKSRGREIFKKLAAAADFIIESFPPGYLDGLGIGYDAISQIYPKVIWASITPFGTEAPYRDFKGPDIVVMGMSGTLYQTGESDGPPVHISLSQACLHAGADAAAGCMVAYHHREKTGEGQRVDVSMQQSAAWFQANAIPSYELNGTILKRAGAFRAGTSSQVGQRQVWRCKDGYLFFNVIGGRTGAKTLSALAAWMDEEKMATDFLLRLDWDSFDMFTVTQETMDKIANPISAFFLKHTRQELLKGAVPRGVSLGPLSSMQDLLEDPCLKERGYWTQIEHPELGASLTYPKEFVRASETDCATHCRAPLTGEHNGEVYKEIGLSEKELDELKIARVI
ncbi:MAG: CaiB/BaiF CoA-transferase family protein [Dehalococcoidales bacterium]|jgi:crotonobetainyl-CoA:carnitine CoA-transferase CaiB-like acyl-CoA transferase